MTHWEINEQAIRMFYAVGGRSGETAGYAAALRNILGRTLTYAICRRATYLEELWYR